MNWLRVDTSFDDNDFRVFNYATRPFKIVKKLHSEAAAEWEINTSEDLNWWIQKYGNSMQQEYRKGTVAILFSRRCEHSSPSSIPVSMAGFSKLIDLFHIHPTIVRTILREVACFNRTYLRDGKMAYTARTCSTWRGDDIALSSTYLPDEELNLCVYYGCNETQSKTITSDLKKADSAIYHPMLPSGLLIELDRKRLLKKIETVTSEFTQATETMSSTSQDLESNSTQTSISRSSDLERSLNLYTEDRELATGIGIVKQQISSMIYHIVELEHTRFTERITRARGEFVPENESLDVDIYTQVHSNNEVRFRERLWEIGREYEQKLDQCHMVLDGLSFITQRASDLANIRIALATKRDSTQMRSIALVTMIFLPVTSVASIFSMGVFNWTASTEQTVLTFYFWVYVAIAGGLTLVTVGTWWVLTRGRKGEPDAAKLA
ncbi:hypothetical protein GGR53DRAFT_153758 [Hypoxylon sp. FL1150]|nr:hypothetical protein GGR53DRAFT_153758 [Hypoxylon sp. FL1150]